MEPELGTTELPRKKTNWFIRTVEATSIVKLISAAIFGYAIIAIVFSIFFYSLSLVGFPAILKETVPVKDFAETVYFNFITIHLFLYLN